MVPGLWCRVKPLAEAGGRWICLEFDVIAAVVIGGTLLAGGRGQGHPQQFWPAAAAVWWGAIFSLLFHFLQLQGSCE